MTAFSTTTGNGASRNRTGFQAGSAPYIYGPVIRKATSSGRRRRHLMRGTAAIRAYTAAQLYREHSQVDGVTLQGVAIAHGSCVQYVRAMLTLIESGNVALIDKVMAGELPVLKAVQQVHKLTNLVTAYRAASPMDRVHFARIIGPQRLFDETLGPAI
jgi:hypothetical protein